MAVMVRETWTDERLDDLNKKVDRGFAETKAEMRDRFDRVEVRMEQMEARSDAKFGQLNDRFDRMQQTLIGGGVVVIAALMGILATQL